MILLGGDGGAVVPAEGFQRLLDELLRLRFAEAALAFGALDKVQRRRGEDPAIIQYRLGEGAQCLIFDQLKA